MFGTDTIYILQLWATFFLLGLCFLPITTTLFSHFLDQGYIFAKILGICVISYVSLVLGELHILPFSSLALVGIIIVFAFANSLYAIKHQKLHIFKAWRLYLLEEIIFTVCLFAWAFVRGLQPDIHGLEKFMDFGFVNSILRSTYFPPTDMWYPSLPINYYYFGHLSTAILTKLANIPSSISFNLMIATIFAFTFTCTFSLVTTLISEITTKVTFLSKTKLFLFGIIGGYIASLGGNLHTIYALFRPYNVDSPVAPWQLPFALSTFPNAYWYPNATRFIYHTIHEFPGYSFVVSDLHGHVLDIPFVLLTLALGFALLQKKEILSYKKHLFSLLIFGFMLAVMYMTNASDGLIYFLLGASLIIVSILFDQKKKFIKTLFSFEVIFSGLILFSAFLIFSTPFSLFFKAFVSQIGILCAPTFLTTIGHIGPFLFEANHCQHSSPYQLLILYGFFYFWVIGYMWFVIKNKKKLLLSDIYVLLLIGLSTLLIIIPEFIYFKDIYPAHYRANTMFKFVYQSFMMLSICTTYIIARLAADQKFLGNVIVSSIYKLIGIILFIFVAIYPYFAIQGYYGTTGIYKGLDGTKYLKLSNPSDYDALSFLQTIPGQPVILEAQGDSYTDYERISANSGLPTVMGWAVHEWLWRGTYDTVLPRIQDVQTMYTSNDSNQVKQLLQKYHVQYVVIGDLERQKYPELNETNFQKLGTVVFQNGNTKVYKM